MEAFPTLTTETIQLSVDFKFMFYSELFVLSSVK